MKIKIWAALELMRPANIVTAFADIFAGFAAVGGIILFSSFDVIIEPSGLGWLLITTFGLYGGGILFNDVFDSKLDLMERPERAIPSGRITRGEASIIGVFLYLIAIFAASQVTNTAILIALFIIFSSLVYNSTMKHNVLLGPVFMGFCRGGNLLLGGSLIPLMLIEIWFIAIIPFFYIFAITLISRGEVEGGSKKNGYLALVMILIVIGSVPILALLPSFNIWIATPFLFLFSVMVLPAFINAAKTTRSDDIKRAVKRGVVSLIIFNSVLAAGFSGIILGVIVLLLFPISIALSKLFSVT